MGDVPDLTVKERTLIHLYKNRVPDWEMELPEGLTQQGIAEKVGVSRAHISQTLISLEEEGLVKSKKSRIKGSKRRKKAYSLKENGRKEGEKLYDFLMDQSISLVVEGESEEYNFKKALEKSDLSVLEIYNKVKDGGRLTISRSPEIEETGEVEEEEKKKETVAEERDHPEKKKRFFVPIFSFILLGAFAALNIINILHLKDDSLLCFYPVGFIVGLILISYFFYMSERRYKLVEQIFSFLILLNVFSVVLFYDRLQDGLLIDDFYSFLLVFTSVMIVTALPLKPIRKYKGEIPYISCPLFISHGFLSYIYPDLHISSSLPLFWIAGGIFLLDIGIRWFERINKKHSVLIGMGLYMIFVLIYWFMEGSSNIIHQITFALWTVFGLFLIITRFVPDEIRKRIYSGLFRGSILSISVFFLMVAWILVSIDKYIEAGIELLLSGIFIFSLYRYKGDIKQVIYFGLPLAVLVFMTFLSMFLF